MRRRLSAAVESLAGGQGRHARGAPERALGASLEGIRRAQAVVRDVAYPTPLLRSDALSQISGANIFLKAENLQRTGSFKVRGAYYKVASLPPHERAAGVIAASAGNHAQGVALAANRAGITATIVMPENAPENKVHSTRSFGARVVLQGERFEDAYAHARAIQKETGAVFVHPFDDWQIIEGQGTLALEILEELPECDAIVAPVGGGGLIGGVALGACELRPAVRVYGVQAAGAAAAADSLAAGRLCSVAGTSTIADGIRVARPGDLTFTLMQRYVADIARVDDDAIRRAIAFAMERARLIVEGAGATPIAALLTGALRFPPGSTVALIVSGGNIDPGLLSESIAADSGVAR